MPNNLLSSFALFSCLILLGFSIGWLVGLSVSPVVGIVVTSVTGAAATGVAALYGGAGEQEGALVRARRNLSVIPLAIYVASLAVGATVAMHERTGGRLAADPRATIERWAAVGIDTTLAAQRLFDLQYPPADAEAEVTAKAQDSIRAVLYSKELELVPQLDRLVGLSDTRFMASLQALDGYETVKWLLAESSDVRYLRERVRRLCDE